jgi:site-specific DNA-methyltransferase (adenine-specific)
MFQLFNEDCFEKLKEFEDNSVDSVVTDPPYFLSFMGKDWDKLDGNIAANVEFWKEILRVLKPGGHLLAFGHSRTHHRLYIAIEDAGFEIRDTIMWLYGSGFPKSSNLGDGWGTALKPAYEPICLARKPFKGTTKNNHKKFGTGGLNIDVSRVGTEAVPINKLASWSGFGQEIRPNYQQEINSSGRWPANVILDEEAGEELDEQSGISKSSKRTSKYNKATVDRAGYTPVASDYRDDNTYGDSGGASRFFYCPKVSKKERNAGCEELEAKSWFHPGIGGSVAEDGIHNKNGQGTVRGSSKNNHPTVKPKALMSYLIKLITPAGGKVLDPFMGSGSTGVAAKEGGFSFIGIEREKDYYEIAKARIGAE